MVLSNRGCYFINLQLTLISVPDIHINARLDKGKRFINFKKACQKDIGKPLASRKMRYRLCF